MEIDADNAVVKLCAEGMMAEGRGDAEEAHALFAQACAASTDDYEACIAAHYLARHQSSPQETLRWNHEALQRADAIGDGRVRVFYPSLYLNLGRSYEDAGDRAEARRCYDLADQCAAELPADGYGAMVRRGIAAGQRRTNDINE